LNNLYDIFPAVPITIQGLANEITDTFSGIRSVFGHDITMHNLKFDLTGGENTTKNLSESEVVTFSWISRPGGEPPYGEV
jgi:hypothetical protein